MTRSAKSNPTRPPSPPRRWLLRDAKARFSELVRRVRSERAQHVTVRGRDAVVVVSAEEFHRLKGDRSGAALIEALQTSPYRADIDIEPQRGPTPVRDAARDGAIARYEGSVAAEPPKGWGVVARDLRCGVLRSVPTLRVLGGKSIHHQGHKGTQRNTKGTRIASFPQALL